MAKSKQQKKKDREKRVAKKKLAEAARRREAAQSSAKAGENSSAGRGQKVITAGVKQHADLQNRPATPLIHRRTGG